MWSPIRKSFAYQAKLFYFERSFFKAAGLH